MIRTLACALFAVAWPTDPSDGPQSRTVSFPDVGTVTYQEGLSIAETYAPPTMQSSQKIGVIWDSLSSDGPGRGLALAKLDAATRAQLKVPEGRGLVATGLEEAGPAWQAGLRNADVLLALDDEPLAEPGDLERLLKKAGERPATLALIRKAKPTTIRVQARIRAELGPVADPPPEFWIGASVSAVAPALRTQLDLPDDRGLAVTDLAEGSPAAAAGLQAGDVILTVDDSPISDPLPLRVRVTRSEGKPLAMEYLRAGGTRSLKVTPIKRAGAAEEPIDTKFTLGFIDLERSGAVLRELGVAQPQPAGAAAAADAPKLDALAAEVKALREAVEALRKAVEGKE